MNLLVVGLPYLTCAETYTDMGYIGCVNLVTWLTFARTHATYVWESL